MSAAHSPPVDMRPEHWAMVQDILRRHAPDCDVWAFGSRARHTAKPYSDLDLALRGAAPLSLGRMAALRDAFSQSDLPWKVDLVDLATVDAAFRKVIEAEKVEVQGGATGLDDWRKSTWGQEISLEYGKALREYDRSRGSYRVFGSNGPIGWTDTALTQGPGVILGRKGAYRGVQFSYDPFFVIDTAYYVKLKGSLDMRWIYYAIIYYALGNIDDGSPIPSTTRAAVYVRELNIPPLEEQRAIASVLSALDDKIELNRRMNETLEQMAQAIFRDWFVDFGPVRRKQEGAGDPIAIMGGLVQDPTRASELAALFSDALGDDGLPEGWRNTPVGLLCERVVNGGTPKRNNPEYWEAGTIPWLSSGEVRQPYITRTREFITKEGLESSSAKWITPDSTVVALYGATAGQVSFVATPLTTNQAVCALTPKANYRYSIYHSLLSLRENMLGLAVGSAQQNLSKALVENLSVIDGGERLASYFDALLMPIFHKIIANENLNFTLAETRDYLLPKLMSGEVRVRAAEEFAEQAL